LDLRYERLRLRREEAEQRLLGSLAACGQQVPIVVVAVAEEPGRFRVIDGFRRLRALVRLGHDTIWATSWELTELDALLLSRGLRTASETAIEQAWLVAELSERFHLVNDHPEPLKSDRLVDRKGLSARRLGVRTRKGVRGAPHRGQL
jgi:ParB-like chromosome segregation protein Spo0J